MDPPRRCRRSQCRARPHALRRNTGRTPRGLSYLCGSVSPDSLFEPHPHVTLVQQRILQTQKTTGYFTSRRAGHRACRPLHGQHPPASNVHRRRRSNPFLLAQRDGSDRNKPRLPTASYVPRFQEAARLDEGKFEGVFERYYRA